MKITSLTVVHTEANGVPGAGAVKFSDGKEFGFFLDPAAQNFRFLTRANGSFRKFDSASRAEVLKAHCQV